MLIDAQTLFADGQALTDNAASENVIDFGVARDMGAGENFYIGVVVTANITGTLQINLEGSVDEAFSTPVVKADLGSMAASAPAGTTIFFRVSPGVMDLRYARLDFNGATGGSVKAFITKDVNATTDYAIGYTVS